MKKSIFRALSVLLLVLLTFYGVGCQKSAYPLKYGAYSFEYAIITNKITGDIKEKSFDDILNDNDDFKNWGNLFSFQVIINDDSEYFYKSDKRCFVLNEGLAFEVIDTDKLKLHLPYWCGYDFYPYDIVIILGCQILYG